MLLLLFLQSLDQLKKDFIIDEDSFGGDLLEKTFPVNPFTCILDLMTSIGKIQLQKQTPAMPPHTIVSTGPNSSLSLHLTLEIRNLSTKTESGMS